MVFRIHFCQDRVISTFLLGCSANLKVEHFSCKMEMDGATKGRIPSNSKTKEMYFEHTLMVGRWLKGKNFFRDLLYFYLWSPSFSFQLGGGKLFVIFLGLFLSLIFPSSS